MFERQIDMRSEPVKKIVALGESTTWGASVSDKSKCWFNVVAGLLEEFQGSKIESINQGIGANVITQQCPSFEHSCGPAALDRVDAEVIAHNPDLLFLSYGLNDSRGGTQPEVFRAALQELIDRVRAKIDPAIVLVNVYYMHEEFYDYPQWEQSSYELSEVFNLIIQQVAEKNNVILADVYAAEVGVDWIVDQDHCHANDLGHRLIAHRVFEAIVRNCSFVACQMPTESLLVPFCDQYGGGPDMPVVTR